MIDNTYIGEFVFNSVSHHQRYIIWKVFSVCVDVTAGKRNSQNAEKSDNWTRWCFFQL